MRTVTVAPADDRSSPHVTEADEALVLPGRGVAAYLDPAALVDAARRGGAGLLHPGYGFASEQPALARACEQAGIAFVGPTPETLERFGDKLAARRLATDLGIPVAAASDGAVDGARQLLAALGPGGAVMVKAVHGGGGRGTRLVDAPDELDRAWADAGAEAEAAFGDGSVYAEALVRRARHVEVQIAGDGSGAVVDVGDRDCSLQRRRQKLVELAPAFGLDPDVRLSLLDAARRLGASVRYRSLGTVEFLVGPDGRWYFLEVNPRLQVEHPVTEERHGVDLVVAQLRLAAGASLADTRLAGAGEGRATPGAAMELRVNAEVVGAGGRVEPAAGTVTRWSPPTGPGVRVDTAAGVGYRPHPGFDSLVAKVIVHTSSGDLGALVGKARRAVAGFEVDGLRTNLPLLGAVLDHPDLAAGRFHTAWLDEHLEELLAAVPVPEPPAGPMVAAGDGPPGTVPAPAPVGGTVVEVAVSPGDEVGVEEPVATLEAMKMQHPVEAGTAGVVRSVGVVVGDTIDAGTAVVHIEPADVSELSVAAGPTVDLDAIRPDLAEVAARQARLGDAARPAAVERRRRTGQRTARENIDDLCDDGSFVEYGGLVVAAQRSRRSLDDLIANTPADGFIAGIGRVNGDRFPAHLARCAVASYDYTVLAGTQGMLGHRKKDRLFELAERLRLPVVLLAEGGGGRPGDVDALGVSGLDCMAFALFAGLSGLVPTVGIVSGRCFAGNAALLGCCDVIIATENASIGMAGPAMIEGGGLGRPRPEDIGPLAVQSANGVVDIAVADEAEAVAAAKRYLSYFQGPVGDWECSDQRLMRGLVPENRVRAYDVRAVIDTLADRDSVLELRPGFGVGILTALVRLEGRPVGLLANNPRHLGGAIDSDAADKAARFMALCDAHDLPVVSLCDTPGFMVGVEAEHRAQVRHFSRMFVTGASLRVPYLTVVLRKGYGLGAQAMARGSFHAADLTVAWPTGEFGGMNLEGAVVLGYRKELEAVEDPEERRQLYDRLLDRLYQAGKGLSIATVFEIDDVIDPAATRDRLVAVLAAAPPVESRADKKRPCVDTW